MKTFAYAAVIAFGLLVIPAAAPATAQFNQDTRLSAEVPFEFVVGGALHPAGEYRITRASRLTQTILRIEQMQNGVRRSGEIFHTLYSKRRGATDESALVFHRYGQQYFLASVWVAGERDGCDVLKSRRERVQVRELEARLAPGAAGAVPEVVTIAAVTR